MRRTPLGIGKVKPPLETGRLGPGAGPLEPLEPLGWAFWRRQRPGARGRGRGLDGDQWLS